MEQNIRFVTGTDCHDWSVYPSETPESLLTDTFPYTFAKCLPTFKGLVMAITDHNRLKCVNSFFNVDKKTLEEIQFEHDGETFAIPLSKGINAIIGDNSIGKSLDYEFISKLNIDEIGIDYFNSVLSKTLKVGRKIDWETITENDLKILE